MKLNNTLRALLGIALWMFILVYPTWAGSTEWQVPLEVANGTGVIDTITLGVHPDATEGVDPLIGEVGLPPWPPSSLFEVRFMVPGAEGLKLDLRDTTHTEREYSIKWQAGLGGYPVTVRWDRASLPYASIYISDGYGGVFIPPANMYEIDSLQVPASMSYIVQLTISAIPGVSPSADPEIAVIPDATIYLGQQFPEYHLDDYVFDADTPDEQIEWFVTGNAALVITIDGDRVMRIHAPEGWTGAETVTITARDVEHHTDNTTATFSVVSGGLPAWTIPVTVKNGTEEARIVQFGIHPDASDSIDSQLGEVALPPWPPSNAFEARFMLPDGYTHSAKDIRKSSTDVVFYRLKWQAGEGGYPVTVTWPEDLPLGVLYIQDDMGGTFIPPVNMAAETQVVIPPEQSFVTGLIISTEAVVDTTPPVGPRFLWYAGENGGVSVSLEWDECIEEHFAYYEILFDTVDFDTDARFSWDWSEDVTLTSQSTAAATVLLPVPDATQYIFKVRAWDIFGNVGDLSSRLVVHAPEERHGLPPEMFLHVWPNPFQASTTIRFLIPRNEPAKIAIYDVTGRRVSEYSIRPSGIDHGVVTWNGTDMMGRKVSTGIYFCRLDTPRGSISKKILLMK